MPMRRSEIGNPVDVSFCSSRLIAVDIHFFASSELKSLYVMMPEALHMEIAATHTTDYNV